MCGRGYRYPTIPIHATGGVGLNVYDNTRSFKPSYGLEASISMLPTRASRGNIFLFESEALLEKMLKEPSVFSLIYTKQVSIATLSIPFTRTHVFAYRRSSSYATITCKGKAAEEGGRLNSMNLT